MPAARCFRPTWLLTVVLIIAACARGDAAGGDAAKEETAARAIARADSLEHVATTLRQSLDSAQGVIVALQRANRNGSSGPTRESRSTPSEERPEGGDGRRDEGVAPSRAEDPSRGLLRFPASKGGGTVTYVGAVRDGAAHGYGYGVWSTGSSYQGEWLENKRHGEGRHQYPDGAVYEGTYVADDRDGMGTYRYKNGQRWEGPWKDNLRNGEGVLYEADGRVRVRGVWERDRLVRELKP